ncbi:hypothetical protein L345_05856, partial [Ophiophagus hannah]
RRLGRVRRRISPGAAPSPLAFDDEQPLLLRRPRFMKKGWFRLDASQGLGGGGGGGEQVKRHGRQAGVTTARRLWALGAFDWGVRGCECACKGEGVIAFVVLSFCPGRFINRSVQTPCQRRTPWQGRQASSTERETDRQPACLPAFSFSLSIQLLLPPHNECQEEEEEAAWTLPIFVSRQGKKKLDFLPPSSFWGLRPPQGRGRKQEESGGEKPHQGGRKKNSWGRKDWRENEAGSR